MATPVHSVDRQAQRAKAVTVATPSATPAPSKAAHFPPKGPAGQSAATARATPARVQSAAARVPTATEESGRCSPQYIIVTLTEDSVHSSDGVTDSPNVMVQTAVSTQMLHQPTLQVYPGQDLYVERGSGDAHFSPPIRSGSYPYSDSTLYSPAPPSTSSSSSYYEAPSALRSEVASRPASVAAAMGGGGVTCYMMGGNNTRAAPATVQWLCENYEGAEGVTLPRSTLYCHYLLHCQQRGLEPVNAASFGKLIRAVFMGLRTRRLGTRGNSKYHYYGLRIKASSSLSKLMQEQPYLALRQQPLSHKHRIKPVQKLEGVTNGTSVGAEQKDGAGPFDISAQVLQYQQFLGPSRVLPAFPHLDLQGLVLPGGVLPEHIPAFQELYREHCEAILDVMVNLQFTLLETLWKTFWRFSQSSHTDTQRVQDERLPQRSLVLLCQYEPILGWTRRCDNSLYQTLVETLIPEVLRPIPSALTQAIRNCAKSLESWLTSAMINIPEEMVRIKVVCVGALSQTLRRYTSLNHLAQAARAVLQNSAQITQMLSDLNRVDFTNVQEQASWVCRCEDSVVELLQRDFKQTLQQKSSLEQWAAWLEAVVSQVLEPYRHNPDTFPKAAKLFLLKWSFYSSMVIRDLTLRSAASFGSFHLVRLLYDEYVYYLVEHSVADAKGLTPIAVMGEFVSGRSLTSLDQDKEEDEEEEDSEEECGELTLPSNGPALGEEPTEPPAKMARTDPGTLFVSTHPD